MTHDWTAFLGPTHNAISTETKLARRLPPPLIWEFTRGTGYASPAIAGERLVFLHRVGSEEIVECLHAETGAPSGSSAIRPISRIVTDTTTARDRVRSSTPAVYSVGAQGQLHCLDLGTGKLIWKRDLDKEYRVPQDFFGTASTPLIEGPLLIVNVGAPGGPCVVGFDKTTGREVWRAGKEWGPSYASPVPAVVHGKRRVFVFAGGESNPPSGGLLSIDPSNGRVDFAFPWRSRAYESVNASCPVVFDNKVFVSASYRAGGALIEIRPDFSHKQLWTTQEFGLHFNTPVYKDGYLYGFDGRNEPDASLACVDAASGRVVWRETPEWAEVFKVPGQGANGSWSGPIGDRSWRSTGTSCVSASSGTCCGWISRRRVQGGFARLAVRGARVVGAAGAEPRPALRHAERAGSCGARPRLLCYDLRA